MTRIVYLGFPTAAIAGGQKMILRHVETLRDLGFEAVLRRTSQSVMPTWLKHRAPVEIDTDPRADDILVVPSDAPNAIARLANLPNRALIFCQNQFSLAVVGAPALDALPPGRMPTFISPGRVCAESIMGLYPQAKVEVIPCFADERIFHPQGARQDAIVAVPRKRPTEDQAIRGFLARRHPRHAGLPWRTVANAAEAELARTMAASTLFLSLSRFEAVGMTPLEAMASGCVCAGFLGVGGREFATPANGFWAPDDDLEAAADALAQAADLVASGGAHLAAHQEAAAATARVWSYAAFRGALEEVWMRLAPEARRQSGPLD
jgi:hypothetical protein